MNDVLHPNGGGSADAVPSPRRPALLILLAVVLFAECALLAAASVFLAVELFVEVPASYASAVAILVISVLATVFLAVLAGQTLQARSWVRGAAIVWQVLQISVGVGFLQGDYARPDMAWGLIVPAVVVIVLVFTRPVREATGYRS
ncbi:hypothetical protein FB562_0547 [Homoserinimonas aerilata]|uniref:Uncharacterized protein n=1 Tax=Homoserinimonas aerilata TaxID=1162970 RepID=A0A542YHD5_9MICO|nr:hypothetical protein [Homoserinimonas aerilata]TQL47486.1 hypothetical protein FB562_0547 [Homoserinimonas aerilata]